MRSLIDQLRRRRQRVRRFPGLQPRGVQQQLLDARARRDDVQWRVRQHAERSGELRKLRRSLPRRAHLSKLGVRLLDGANPVRRRLRRPLE
jgi:hypothetical protein